MADVDQQLLAISDMMVLTALERAWARTVKRSGRVCPPAWRHTQYMEEPVPEHKFQPVLHDAWVLCQLMRQRYGLDVDPDAWVQTLDGYTRALLMTQERHQPERLAAILMEVPRWSGGAWPYTDAAG